MVRPSASGPGARPLASRCGRWGATPPLRVGRAASAVLGPSFAPPKRRLGKSAGGAERAWADDQAFWRPGAAMMSVVAAVAAARRLGTSWLRLAILPALDAALTFSEPIGGHRAPRGTSEGTVAGSSSDSSGSMCEREGSDAGGGGFLDIAHTNFRAGTSYERLPTRPQVKI